MILPFHSNHNVRGSRYFPKEFLLAFSTASGLGGREGELVKLKNYGLPNKL
jgi:hypothetical protein